VFSQKEQKFIEKSHFVSNTKGKIMMKGMKNNNKKLLRFYFYFQQLQTHISQRESINRENIFIAKLSL
jgi:hypothetical protein